MNCVADSLKKSDVKSEKLKIVYLGTEPEADVRMRKIEESLKKHGYQFEILKPKFRTIIGGRAFSAVIRYVSYMLQIFLSQADLYWVANAPDVVATPLIIRRRKYIYDFRSVWSNEIRAEFGPGLWVFLARVLERLSMKNAKIIVLNTDTLAGDAEPFGKPLLLVPNYPSNNFKATVHRSKFRETHGVKADTKVVLYVGRLSRVEGADRFPEILRELKKHREIKIWIVGAGPLESLIKRLEETYPKTLKFFGWQPYEMIPNFINAADVCIAPRHADHNSPYYNEKGVMKISEYMMFKKPIVCSGIAPSSQYLLVKEEELVDGIMKALIGEAPTPTPKTWEEHAEPKLLEVVREGVDE